MSRRGGLLDAGPCARHAGACEAGFMRRCEATLEACRPAGVVAGSLLLVPALADAAPPRGTSARPAAPATAAPAAPSASATRLVFRPTPLRRVSTRRRRRAPRTRRQSRRR